MLLRFSMAGGDDTADKRYWQIVTTMWRLEATTTSEKWWLPAAILSLRERNCRYCVTNRRSQFQSLNFAFDIMSNIFVEFQDDGADFLQLPRVHVGDNS